MFQGNQFLKVQKGEGRNPITYRETFEAEIGCVYFQQLSNHCSVLRLVCVDKVFVSSYTQSSKNVAVVQEFFFPAHKN